MKSFKKVLLTLAVSATIFELGCGGLGGSAFWRMVGDAVGDTLAYNVFLD
jgi:hypothetical protein